MNVSIKFRTGEVLRGIRSGQYEIPEGSTIDEALDTAVSENGMTLADHDREYLFALLNNRQVQMDSILKDGDSVWILFKILGG
ncbi:MAG: MoaD/ThiS family protein [Lachnospiraceae bacterium]|nr:MoaD/ThiS family protein [Lachnospiraceae bacterium]